MKSLRLQRLSLYSPKEKTARTEQFDPKVTVVLGENDTGKSCLLKSIYASFGADAAKINPKWTVAETELLLAFTIDDVPYSILRSGPHFALFDAKQHKLWHETSVVSGLGPKIADLFNFKLKLQTREGLPATPPPAFSLLPFYVDQDIGWQAAWSSFSKLGMHPKYKTDVAYFHAGLRPNEFYEAKAQLAQAQHKKLDLNAERTALERATKRLRAGRRDLKFDLQPALFGDRLDDLLKHCQSLQVRQETIQHKLAQLYSERAVILEQINIVKAAMQELDADVQFSTEFVDSEIICPTCSTVHQNDFANRYGLVSDTEACRSFLIDVQEPLAALNAKIESERERLNEFTEEITHINAILDEKRGDIKFRDLLEGESERLLDSAIEDEQKDLAAKIGEQDIACDNAQATMKSFQDKNREKEINAFYFQKMKLFLADLNVSLADASYKRVDSLVKETGSDLPRALLAQYFAFLHTVNKYSTSFSAPIVIDTPIQQDQDKDNAKRMIEFALANVPDGMQLILGSVSLHGATYGGAQIGTATKYHLLEARQYEDVGKLFAPYLAKLLDK